MINKLNKNESGKKIKVLGIIPARGGSKGIPLKNIALLAGKPLLYYTLKAAKESKLLDAFIVSTDNVLIAEEARKLGADVPFMRPKKFARDQSFDIEYLQHAVTWLEKNRGWRPEIVVILYPTAPLRIAVDIDRVVGLMLKTGCDSVKTISLPDNNPFKMWRMKEDGSGKMLPLIRTKYYPTIGTLVPRQLLPTVYWQNGLVNATRLKFIHKGKVYGPDIRGVVTDPHQAVDIDRPEDLKAAAKIINIFHKKR
jgi:CMP-N,N'-diacetyllegionaminic acid synthase